MSDDVNPITIETDLFFFEAPAGYQIVSLDEEAELVGPNDEFLVVSSYSLDSNADDQQLSDFVNNIANAMVEAADEPDLTVTGQLSKVVADNGLPVWSVLSKATDQSHFFDQYAVIKNDTAVVVTIEGNYVDRGSSADVEEAVKGDDVDDINAKVETLMQASHKLAEQMYAGAEGAEGGAAQEEAPQDDNVVDAEFEEVNDEDDSKKA